MPDMNAADQTKKKKKRRSRKTKTKKQVVEYEDNQNLDGGTDSQSINKNSRKKKHKRRDDRYYGRFHCLECNRHWDSAHVYTIGGTKKVKFKQRCMKCENSWLFPYCLQILECSQCNEAPCTCLCEDCKKLKHKRFFEIRTEEGDTEEVVDKRFSYCTCERRKDIQVGKYIDQKKNHRSDLCEKCLKGRPCVYKKDGSEIGTDNEP